jgi:hypothetical protein
LSGFTVTIRAGSKVQRTRHETAPDALREVERRGHELEASADAKPRSPLGRRFEPVQQVVARIELSGPDRLRAGVDVRGDGSSEAYTGRLRKQVIEQRGNESPYDALRRVVNPR